MYAQLAAYYANARTTAKNASWIIGGKMVMFALSFGFITALANLVSPDVAGSYQYILSILTIASIATLPGMNSALVRAVARGSEGTKHRMMHLKLAFGLIGSFVAGAVGIFYLAQGATMLGYAFLVAAPFVPLTDTFSEMAYGLYQGRKQFNRSTLFGIITYALFFIPAIAIMFITDNLIIIAGSFFALQAAAGMFTYQLARPANNDVDESSVKLGFQLTALGILRTIAWSADRMIIWQILGPVSVAIYTFAATPMNKLEQLIPIEALMLPDLSRTPETPEAKKMIWKKMILMILAMIPLVVLGIIIAPLVFGLLFPTFPESAHLFQLLAIALVLAPIGILRTSFIAWHHKRELAIIETASPIIRIICMVAGGIAGGMIGLVIGILASKAIESLVVIALFAKAKKINNL